MQINNVSEVQRIGGLSHICVVAEINTASITGQIRPHSCRTLDGTAVDPKVKRRLGRVLV